MIDQISLIEQKRNENENVDEPPKNDWKSFGKELVFSTLLTIFIALIGVNFIYFTSLNDESQNVFFPSELKKYFQTEETQNLVGGSPECRHTPTIVLGELSNTLKKMGVPPSSGWPYSMKSGGSIDLTVQGIKNWISLSVADYYSNGRYYIKKILRYFNNEERHLFSTDFSKILCAIIIIPFILFVTSFTFVTSFISSLIRAWKDSDILFLAFVFFLGPAFILSSGLSLIVPLQFLFTFLFIPLFTDHNMVFKILSCNIEIFILFFLSASIICVLKNELDPTIGIIIPPCMGIVYLIYKIFFKSK